MLGQPQKIDRVASVLVRPWIWAVLVAVVTLATYVPALSGEFVWDDVLLIDQSPAAHRDKPIGDYFTKPFWEADSVTPQRNLYYRPLVLLSYSIDRSIHGLNSAGFRLTNYAFHLANVILLFSLIIRRGASGLSAALLSATWGVLPRLAENVAWISGRTDVFAATAVLAALLVWGDRWRQLLLASLLLVLGLFCKETAYAGVVSLTALELSQGSLRSSRTIKRLLVLILPVVGWLVLKTSVSGLLPSGTATQTTRVRILSFLEAVGHYATMIVDWLRPRAEIGILGEPDLPVAAIGAVVLVATIPLLVWAFPRLNSWARAALLGALAAIAPVLHFVQLTVDVNAADRFLYIPLVLLALAAGASARLQQSRIAQAAWTLVLVTSIPITVARAKTWTDPVKLWSDEYRVSGGKCRTGRLELARMLADAGDYAPALRLQQGLMHDSIHDGHMPALVALDMSILFIKLGDYDRAKRLLGDLVANQPDIPRFWRELATVQAATYDFAAAEASAKHALQLMPSYENARVAVELIEKLEQEYPSLNSPATADAMRAEFFTTCSRIKDAEPIWLKILSSNPSAIEVEGALNFFVNMGTSSGVITVLHKHANILHDFPYLTMRLDEKRKLHDQLAHLKLLP